MTNEIADRLQELRGVKEKVQKAAVAAATVLTMAGPTNAQTPHTPEADNTHEPKVETVISTENSANEEVFYLNGMEIVAGDEGTREAVINAASQILTDTVVKRISGLGQADAFIDNGHGFKKIDEEFFGTEMSATKVAHQYGKRAEGDMMRLVGEISKDVTNCTDPGNFEYNSQSRTTIENGQAVGNHKIAEVYDMMDKIDKGFMITTGGSTRDFHSRDKRTYVVDRMPENYHEAVAQASKIENIEERQKAYGEILKGVRCRSLVPGDQNVANVTETSMYRLIGQLSSYKGDNGRIQPEIPIESFSNVNGIIGDLLSKDPEGKPLPTDKLIENIEKAGIKVTRGEAGLSNTKLVSNNGKTDKEQKTTMPPQMFLAQLRGR